MAKKEDLRQLTAEALQERVDQNRRELFELRSDRATRKGVEKTHLFRVKRRDIARALTLLTELKSRPEGELVAVKAPAKKRKVEAAEAVAVEAAPKKRRVAKEAVAAEAAPVAEVAKPKAKRKAPAEEAEVKVAKPRKKKAEVSDE
jgi:ribosomal protein L29